MGLVVGSGFRVMCVRNFPFRVPNSSREFGERDKGTMN